MAPSARAQQSGLVKGIANYHYQQTPDKTPLRPLAALLRTRWVKDVQKQILTHEDTFYELIINGYFTQKNDLVFSTYQQATDYLRGRLPAKATAATPAPMVYKRDPYVQSDYNAKKLDDLDHTTLPKGIQVSLPLIEGVSRRICNYIISTVPQDTIKEDYQEHCAMDGLKLLAYLPTELSTDLKGDADDAVDEVLEATVRLGLESASESSVSSFLESYKAWNVCHVDSTRVHPDHNVATKLARVLRRAMGAIAYNVIKKDMHPPSPKAIHHADSEHHRCFARSPGGLCIRAL